MKYGAQGNTMTLDIANLKRDAGLSESSFKHYTHRLERLQRITDGKSLAWILENPVGTLKYLKARVSTNPSTLANFAVAVCKMYTVHPEFMNVHKRPHGLWSGYIKHYRNAETRITKKSEFNERQNKNLVTWAEVEAKYCALRDAGGLRGGTGWDMKLGMATLLMSALVGIQAKRADLGNIKIYSGLGQVPVAARKTTNYLYFKSGGALLVLNKYKTAKSMGAIREELPGSFVRDLKASLGAFPREYMFVSAKTGQPYELNNSYSAFVKRVCGELFGRAMGVSLWRHIYITANVDFNETSYDVLEREAKLRGHSLAQELMTYRKTGVRAGVERRVDGERGEMPTCGHKDRKTSR